MRASKQAITCGFTFSACALSAQAAKVETPTTGRSAAKAKPCVTAAATRTPVNAPGPCPKAMPSRSASRKPASSSIPSTMGNTRSVCWRGACSKRSITLPLSNSATEQVSPAVSNASIRVMIPFFPLPGPDGPDNQKTAVPHPAYGCGSCWAGC